MRSKLESTKSVKDLQTAISDYLAEGNTSSFYDAYIASRIVTASLAITIDEELISSMTERLKKDFNKRGADYFNNYNAQAAARHRLSKERRQFYRLIDSLSNSDKQNVVASALEAIKF